MKKKNLVLMLVFTLLLIVGFGSFCRATPIQWKIEDGGNGHWYEAISVPDGISWTDARNAARLILLPGGYGDLVTITSAAENEFVFALLSRDEYWNDDRGPWLGGTDAETEGIWQWVTGEPWSYANWSPSQPDNARGDENYLHFHEYFGHTPTWNDLANWPPGPFIKGYVVEIPELATILLLTFGGLTIRKFRR